MKNLIRTTFLLPICSLFSYAQASILEAKDYTGPECGTFPIMDRVPACGVERYNQGTAEVCGNKYETKPDPNCGAQSYIYKESGACGVAEYNTKIDAQICGIQTSSYEKPSIICKESDGPFTNDWKATGKFLSTRHEQDCPLKYAEENKCMSRTYYICELAKPKSCANAKFGVKKYKACEHPSHGVALWKTCSVHVGFSTCEHPAFGAAQYQLCQTGTQNKTCSVYFAPSEVPNWLTVKKSQISTLAVSFTERATKIIRDGWNQAGFACYAQSFKLNKLKTLNNVLHEEMMSVIEKLYFEKYAVSFDTFNFTGVNCSIRVSGFEKRSCDLDNTPSTTTIINELAESKETFAKITEELNQLKQGNGSLQVAEADIKEIDNMLTSISLILESEK